jgi:YidC/Oxa1 family membrane protein insertase
LDAFNRSLASLLSFYYDLVPDYAAAIAMLTVTVMLVLLPLTLKGTRSMLAMQRLSPEIKKLQDKHKNDRAKLNEEVMALYRDNKINPLGGCLPLLLQLPVFFVMYQVIAGLTRKVNGVADPKYLEHNSEMYRHLVEAGGKMESFGIDLARAATSDHSSFISALPYYLFIVLMVTLQYIQQWQISSRAPAADTPQAQQMRIMQKIFPPIFGLISISFQAGLVLYWVVQSLCRVIQQWAMYRYDPVLKTQVNSAKKEAAKFLAEDDNPRAQKSSNNNKKTAGNKSNKKKRKGR